VEGKGGKRWEKRGEERGGGLNPQWLSCDEKTENSGSQLVSFVDI